MAQIEGLHVTKKFGGLVALDQLNFILNNRDILGIVGPNGSGKTTLFNILSGIYQPTTGSVLFEGRSLKGLTPSSICKMGIARTYQLVRPFMNLSVIENVMVGACFGADKEMNKECTYEAMSILEKINLCDKYQQPAKSLTVAERKRLEVGRAWATDPKVILLDEVMAGLNPKETEELVCLIKDIYKTGVTICIIEHVMKAVSELCNRILVLNNGRRIFEGKPEEMVNNEEVITAYLGKKHSKEMA